MKQKFRAVSLIIACLIVLAGCSTNNAAQNGSQAKSEEGKQPSKEVTLKVMHWYSYVTDEIFREFERQNPGIKVDNQYVAFGDPYFVKLKGLANTNELPDIVALGGRTEGTYDLIAQGKIMDLNDAMSTPAYDSEETWLSTQSDVLMNSLNSLFDIEMDDDALKPKNGHQWALPFGAISLSVIYNKSIFEQVGIKEPETFEQFLENNDKLKEAGYIPLAHANKEWGSWWLTTFLDQTARDVKTDDFVSGKVAVDDVRLREAFEIWEDMIKRGHFDKGVVSAGIDDAQALFVQQKAAQFYIVPENFVKYLVDNMPEGVKLGAFVLPGAKGLPSRSIGGSSNKLAVSAESEHPEEALKLMKFLTSNTLFQLLSKDNVVPSLKGYQPPEGDAIMSAYAKAYENGFAEGHFPPFSPEILNIDELNSGMLIGEYTTDDILKKMSEAWPKEPNNKQSQK